MSALLTPHRLVRPRREKPRSPAEEAPLFGAAPTPATSEPLESATVAPAPSEPLEAATVAPATSEPLESAAVEQLEAAATSSTTASARRQGPTLDDLVAGAWEGLLTGAPAVCIACGSAMAPRHSAGAGVVGGRCGGCGSTLG